jgi:hypothetical protein
MMNRLFSLGNASGRKESVKHEQITKALQLNAMTTDRRSGQDSVVDGARIYSIRNSKLA